MARKVVAPATTADEGSDFLLEDTYDADALSPALSRLEAELGVEAVGQVMVNIYKVLPDGRLAVTWKGAPEDYDLMSIAKRHGSADYCVRVYAPRGDGTNKVSMRASKVYPVLLDPADEARLKAEREGVPANHNMAPAITVDAITAAVVAAMKQAMPAPVPAPSPVDSIASLGQLVAALKPLIVTPAPAAPAADPLATLAAVMGIVKEAREADAPPPEGGASMMDILYKLVDRAAPLMERLALAPPLAGAPLAAPDGATRNLAAGGMQALPQPAVDQPAQPAQPGAPQSKEEEMRLVMLAKLRMALGFLCDCAQSQGDPSLYAEMVLEHVPPEDLTRFLAEPDFVAFLAGIHADVANHRPWFDQLKGEVLALRNEEAAATSGTPPA